MPRTFVDQAPERVERRGRQNDAARLDLAGQRAIQPPIVYLSRDPAKPAYFRLRVDLCGLAHGWSAKNRRRPSRMSSVLFATSTSFC